MDYCFNTVFITVVITYIHRKEIQPYVLKNSYLSVFYKCRKNYRKTYASEFLFHKVRSLQPAILLKSTCALMWLLQLFEECFWTAASNVLGIKQNVEIGHKFLRAWFSNSSDKVFRFFVSCYYAISIVFEINLQISIVAIYHKFSIKLGFLPGSLFPRTRIYQIRLVHFQMQSIYQIIQIQIKDNPFPGNYFFCIFPSFVGDIFSLNFQKKKDSWVSKLAMNYALT